MTAARVVGWAALALLVWAGGARATSAIQTTPDGRRTLVAKSVGAELWAVVRGDGVVTGNAYPLDGGDPGFVWCRESGADGRDLRLDCRGAARCTASPCFEAEWSTLAPVSLAEGFFRARAGEAELRTPPASGPAPASGLRPGPDGDWVLVSREVGADRWAIAFHRSDRTLTGITFSRRGGPVQFVWCKETAATASDVTLACAEATPCEDACSPSDWQPIGAVTLPRIFFEPPASYANFESTSVHPIRVSADGSRLYAVHTPDNHLSIFDLADPSSPERLREVPVGLEPVSVTERTQNEVWVANVLSDSVTVLDPTDGRILDVLQVDDEPSDVVFAAGKAFVSAAMRDEIHVFDADARERVATIPIFGKEPRALATNADATRVFALVHRSGNGTTILHHIGAPKPLPPTNPALPAAPEVGRIVRADDPAWADRIRFTMPDQDVFEIDSATHDVVARHRAVGTMNFDLIVHPGSGDLFVSNTDARNLVRSEPELRGRFVETRLSRIDAQSGAIEHFDLNESARPGVLSANGVRLRAMADPGGIVLDASRERLYVASQGTDRIGVFDLERGRLRDRIDVGDAQGGEIDTTGVRGPRGLALHPSGRWLYVHNRLSDTVSVVDTRAGRVVRELAIGAVDPVPRVVREGRKFLYDAKRGNGTGSCASCHIDADADNLLWDLGDPGGDLAAVPTEFRFDGGEYPGFHPMKGPMVTQTLRGLVGVGPLHWRGDRENFEAFNGAFDALMGGEPLSDEEMDLFAAWSRTVHYPPNPNQRLDRGLRDDPEASEQIGFDLFSDPTSPGRCGLCHPIGVGTVGMIRRQPILETQPIKIAHLRNVYRKVELDRSSTEPQKIGIGVNHDGAGGIGGSFEQIVTRGVALVGREDLAPHLIALLRVWDTGTAPAVGRQVRLDVETAGTVDDTLELLRARATAGDVDLVALGSIDGEPVGLLYDVAQKAFVRGASGPTASLADLRELAREDRGAFVLTGAFPGTGKRMALDRDRDGIPDEQE